MKSAIELRDAFAARELSPVEVIDAITDETGAYITLTLDAARIEAQQAERAYRDGTARPLEGLPLAVKDLFDTAGVTTTYGSSIYRDHVPTTDAEAVARAKRAGAIVVGKTLTHEFAWGITSVNPHFAPCRNPWDRERVAGGSSGGSAVALAAGAAALALGTDTGGSIRIPAAFCGVSGLKPTYDKLPTTGVLPLAPSLDHAGPMGRTPADVRLLYEALAGPAGAERATTIAVCPDLHGRITPGIQAVFEAAAGTFERVVEVPFGLTEHLYPAYAAIQNTEAVLAHAERFPARRAEYGADVARRLDFAAGVTRAEYAEAIAQRERIRSAFAAIFTQADLLLTPVSGVPPELAEQPTNQEFRDGVLPFTVPQDLTGLPACAVPVGFDELGLPVGVQLTGPAHGEGRVLAAAEALFRAT